MRRGVAIAAALTAIAAAWTFFREEKSPVPPVESKRTQSGLSTDQTPILTTRMPLPGTGADPFALPPPPPPPAPPPVVASPPSTPQRPLFPYQYFGRLTNANGDLDTYLQRDGQLIALRQGLSLEPGFIVESVTEAQVVIRHHPTGDIVRIDLPTFKAQ